MSFIYFGKNVESDILTLNIIVSSVIYGLFFIDIIIPWVDFKNKSQKTIGSLGVRGFFTFLYSIIAIGGMVVFNQAQAMDFNIQILIHSILFFLLLFGFYLALTSSEKVREVFEEEKQNRDQIDSMKRITKELQLKLDTMPDIPSEIILRINELQENLRYLSPCNNSTAVELEKQFIDEMRVLDLSFSEIPLNSENTISHIKNCERTYKERKQVFSN
ncbi:MAG: hypothetical protein Q8O88_05675 [bacterium]|nr:hypothetical protein [bacterium]